MPSLVLKMSFQLIVDGGNKGDSKIVPGFGRVKKTSGVAAVLELILEGLGEHLDPIRGFYDPGFEGLGPLIFPEGFEPAGRMAGEKKGSGLFFGLAAGLSAEESLDRPREVSEHGFGKVMDQSNPENLFGIYILVDVITDPECDESDAKGMGGDGLRILNAADLPTRARKGFEALGAAQETQKV